MTGKNQESISEITTLVIHDFNVDREETDLVSSDMKQFRAKLESLINYLLDKDFERLLMAMYRLDIDEVKFAEVLEGKSGPDIAASITDLVIERELRKIETRKKYKC